MSEERRKDVVILTGELPDGRISAIRVGEDGASAGFFTRVSEGQSLAGLEVVSLGARVGPGYELDLVYDGRASGGGRPADGGPAMVNSREFRSGWDAVYGKKAEPSLN